jgi:hypothetical protein|tara:strand:- start:3596 stop:3937 length:342 start_codon:yes stop_codon:yes gene_type:complete
MGGDQLNGEFMADRYTLRYLCDGYILADAFRPILHYGERIFSVDGSALPDHTEDDIVKLASETAPDGYWLQRVTAIEHGKPERTIFGRQVPTHRSAYASYHQSGASGFHQAEA